MDRLPKAGLLPIVITLATIAGCAAIHHPHADAIALPEGVAIEPPGPDVPAAYAAYVGEWEQTDISSHNCILAITNLDLGHATAFYDCEGGRWIPLAGGFPVAAHGALVLRSRRDDTMVIRRRPDGELRGSFCWSDVTFTKVTQRLTPVGWQPPKAGPTRPAQCR